MPLEKISPAKRAMHPIREKLMKTRVAFWKV